MEIEKSRYISGGACALFEDNSFVRDAPWDLFEGVEDQIVSLFREVQLSPTGNLLVPGIYRLA